MHEDNLRESSMGVHVCIVSLFHKTSCACDTLYVSFMYTGVHADVFTVYTHVLHTRYVLVYYIYSNYKPTSNQLRHYE